MHLSGGAQDLKSGEGEIRVGSSGECMRAGRDGKNALLLQLLLSSLVCRSWFSAGLCRHPPLFAECLSIHIDVVCALVGSLGALYTGLVLANLALALFALVAVESNNQTLCRVYGSLLAFALLLDIVWFILFTSEIRQFSKDSQVGKFGTFSIKLLFLMQATGCALRFVSSCLWIQIYRLGAATDISSRYQPVEFRRRITSLNVLSAHSAPIAINARSTSMSDDLLGSAIYAALPSRRQCSSDVPSDESCVAINARSTSMSDEMLETSIYNPAAFISLRQSSSDEYSAEPSEPPANTA